MLPSLFPYPSPSPSPAMPTPTQRSSSALRRRIYASSTSSCSPCKHSPSAILDLLVLALVLFSSAFLIASFLSYLLQCLSYLFPPLLLHHHSLIPYSAAVLLFLAASLALALEISSGGGGGGGDRSPRPRPWWCWWSRRCRNPRCRGMKKALEFDVRLQTEDCINSHTGEVAAAWKEIDDLPWKGGGKGNSPEYDCLRTELKRLAPPNGRAVLLFRARCGCPLAKLESWGLKQEKLGRRGKKSSAALPLEGGD